LIQRVNLKKTNHTQFRQKRKKKVVWNQYIYLLPCPLQQTEHYCRGTRSFAFFIEFREQKQWKNLIFFRVSVLVFSLFLLLLLLSSNRERGVSFYFFCLSTEVTRKNEKEEEKLVIIEIWDYRYLMTQFLKIWKWFFI
jgi:hypothetical protein